MRKNIIRSLVSFFTLLFFWTSVTAQNELITSADALLQDAFQRLDLATERYRMARQNGAADNVSTANRDLKKALDDIDKLQRIKEALIRQGRGQGQIQRPEANPGANVGVADIAAAPVAPDPDVGVQNIPVNQRPPIQNQNPARQDNRLVIVRPKPAVDSKYLLEVKSNFELANGARKYKVVTRRGAHQSKPIEVPIIKDKDNPNRPMSPQRIQIELFEGVNTVAVSVLNASDQPIDGLLNEIEIECEAPCEVFGRSINTRAIIGLEQVGASSAAGKAQPFLNLFINVPLGTNDSPRRTPSRVAIWSDFRITSSTAQRLANLSNISTNILRPSANSEINEVVQSFRINAGMDIRIIPEKTLFPSFLPGKSSISFIFGAGVTSPITSGKNSVTEIFKIPRSNGQVIPEFRALFPEIGDDKTNVAFVTPERDRFQRRWFGGGRLKTHFFKSNSASWDVSPAMLDVTIGQDEAITRKLSGLVLNFEGFTPFPIRSLDYLYLYGGISTRLTRKVNTNVPSFFLEPANLGDLADPLKTVLISADENRLTISNRDRYFFGIGVDLIRLFRQESREP